MIAYGLAGSFFVESNADDATYNQVFGVVIMALFVLVGFGLVLSYYRFGNWLGMATAIVVVAVSVQLAPLLQKFWFSVFISGFGTVNSPDSVGANIQTFWRHYGLNNIEVSQSMERTMFLSCISILTLMTAVVGRLNVNEVLKVTASYQILWNLNYFLLIYLAVIKQDFNTAKFTPYHFDRFGTTFNYLFAAFFGLIYVCFLGRQKIPYIHPRNESSRVSLVFCAIGTAFLWATFMFTYNDVIVYSAFGENLTRFNIIWGLTASVLGTYSGSALAGRGRVGFKEALVGTITGGIVMGGAAPVLDNIGINLMIAFLTGLISGVYMRTLHPRINKNNIYDTLGLFGPFLISAFIGSIIIAPSTIIWYHNHNITKNGIAQPYPFSLAGWQLVYAGISAALGLGGGLFAGILSICDKNYFGLASNSRMFENDFGLYTPQGVNYGVPPVTPIQPIQHNSPG